MSKKVTSPKLWGPPLWDILHYITFRYCPSESKKVERLFLYDLPNLMPCRSCRNHYKRYCRDNPIKLASRESLSRWLIKIHNLVNQQLGKPKQSYENMRFRYTNQSSTERVRQSFIKWTSIMKVNVVKGDLKIQRSYGTLLSFIFNYV